MIRAFCWHQKFVPKGFSAVAPGLYTCIKSLKMCINQISKRSFWNLQHMGKEKRPFCCHENFVPNGLSAPALGYIHTVKHKKNVYKIGIQSNFFNSASNGQSDEGFLLTSKVCPQGVVCPCPGAIYMYKSIKIYTRTRCQVSVYRTTGLLVTPIFKILERTLWGQGCGLWNFKLKVLG